MPDYGSIKDQRRLVKMGLQPAVVGNEPTGPETRRTIFAAISYYLQSTQQ